MQRSILITGCSSGIGYAAAHDLRAAGWRVFASCRQQSDCDRLSAQGFDAPLLDLTDPATIRSALDHIVMQTGGTLDALYNNGAFACPGAVEDLPRDALKAVFEANVFGTHDLTCEVIKIMRKQGHGRIVTCSSVLGLVAYKWRGAYVASKFALEGLMDVLRLELRDTPIKVVLVEPGPITSKIRVNSIPHFERWVDWKNSARAEQYQTLTKRLYEDRGPDRFELPPSAVTAKILRALTVANPAPRYYVTTPTYLMGTLRRLLPTRALDWLIAKG